MSEVRFDVNQYVKVRLTKRGLEILKQQHDELYASIPSKIKRVWSPPVVDAEGYSEFQLHHLMNIFGEQMHCENAHLPFDTEIKFTIPVLQTCVQVSFAPVSQERLDSIKDALAKSLGGGFVANVDSVMGGAKITNHEIDLEK
ncbi:MAG: hypothetical protein VXW65_01260 [Pseudomonadota bacterium]|nr:hypothetical protein [Pseudomonadota bacterium]